MVCNTVQLVKFVQFVGEDPSTWINIYLHLGTQSELSARFPISNTSLTLVLLNGYALPFANSVDPDLLASDLDLHCLSFSVWIYINILDQVF